MAVHRRFTPPSTTPSTAAPLPSVRFVPRVVATTSRRVADDPQLPCVRDAGRVQITVLGALAVDGRAVPGQRLSDLVRALVDARGRVVTHASLVESVWHGSPPDDEVGALQALVARVRRTGLAVVTSTDGYRLPLDGLTVDVLEAEALLARGRRELAEGSPSTALDAARRARALFDDLAAAEPGWAASPAASSGADGHAAARTVRLLADVVALRTEAALATGEVAQGAADPLDDLRVLALRTPPDEPLVALLVRALAAQGRDAEALHVIDQLRSELAERYGTDPSPVVAAVHLALLRGELASPVPAAPPPATPTPPEHLLARPAATWRRALTTLVGREVDLEQIEDELAADPLVTLVAVGGAGKTRLALELARRAAARGEDVHAVELAGLRDSDEVLPALLSALGASESAADTERPQLRRMLTPEDRLRRAVADLHGLLVLDNCEQVLDGAATAVAGLLAVAPGDLHVLVTSRSALGVAGETVHPVLALPDDVALRLLETRARAGRPSLAWDPVTALELCRRLDHLPLAIELAAARLRTMPLDDVLAGVVDRFGLLDDALRGLPDQHAGLWAMVDWSWTLLAPDDRALLATLSVFPAPFTAEAAEAVAVDPAAPGSDVRRGLATLVEHSLLTLEDSGPTAGGARYRMLETVREYGAARLDSDARRSAVMPRLAGWAAATATSHGRRLAGSEQLDALACLTADQETLMEALRWAVAEDHERESFAIGAALLITWSIRGLHAEALTWARLVLRADSATRGTSVAFGARPAAVDGSAAAPAPDDVATVALLAGLSGGIADDLRALVLGRRAAARVLADDADSLSGVIRKLLLALDDVLRATISLDVSVLLPATAALVEDGDPYLRGLGFLLRSGARENLGDVAGALDAARAAFDQFAATGNHWGMAMAAQGIGLWESGPGGTEPGRWLVVAQENFELVGAAQDARSIAVARVVDAAVRGDVDARPTLEEVVASGAYDVGTHAQALGGLAALDAAAGRWDDAIARADEAVTLTFEGRPGGSHARVVYQGAAAMTRIRSGRPDAVREGSALLDAALPGALATHDVPVVSTVGLGYAELAAYLGDVERARELWSLAMRLGSHTAMLFGTPAGPLAKALGDDDSRAGLRAGAETLTNAEATARLTALLSGEDGTVASATSSGT